MSARKKKEKRKRKAKRRERGWTRLVPTSVLVFLVRPGLDRVTTPVGIALSDRRFLRGWRAVVAERRLLEVDLVDAEELVVLRGKWPLGITPRVVVGGGEAIESPLGSRVLVVNLECDPRVEASRPISPRGMDVSYEHLPPDRFRLPKRGLGAYVEAFIVRITVEGRAIARWRVEKERYEVVESVDEAMPGVDSAEIGAAVRSALRAYGLVDWFSVMGFTDAGKLGRLHLKGEVLVDGVVVGPLHRHGFSVGRAGDEGRRRASLVRVPSGVKPAEFVREHVSLRLTGDQREALGDPFAVAYWAGTVEVSMGELLSNAP